MDNNLVVKIRDSSCGAGGIHCPCCKGGARKTRGRKDRSFGGIVRTRIGRADATDRADND